MDIVRYNKILMFFRFMLAPAPRIPYNAPMQYVTVSAWNPVPGFDPRITPLLSAAAPLDLAICFGIGLAAKGVIAVKSRLDRAVYLRHAAETAAKSGTPSPSDVAHAWKIPHSPRTPAAALILGDQLLAVEVPSAMLHTRDESGRCVIASRGGGLKEGLTTAAPTIPYTTAMRYRLLAGRLRQWLQLPADIPLSWLFPTAPSPASLTPSAPPRRQIAHARRAFCSLLADYPSLARLQRRLETDLGILAARWDDAPFAACRDLDGHRDTPPPPVPAPKWHPTQTLLDLPRLSQPPPTARRRHRQHRP